MKIIILFVLILLFTYSNISKPVYAVARVAPRKIALAHKYHGILSSFFYNGKWCFYRNGKLCVLFTDEFLNSYNNNLMEK